jgi:serine/threonine protein kinase
MKIIKIKIFLLFITPMVLNLNHCIKMNSKLSEQCPKYSLLLQENHENESQETKELLKSGKNFRELTNLQNFVSTILNGEKPIGEGYSGSIFPFEYIDQDNERFGVVAKIQKINDIRYDKKAKKKHIQMAKEIEVNKLLYAEENGPYFFTKIYGSFEFTDLADENIDKVKSKFSLDDEIKNALFHIQNEGLITIFMERLDISFTEVIELFLHKFHDAPFYERLNLFILAMQGLEIINKDYLHCDIKPENIMLKKIPPEKAQEMISKNFIPFRTGKTSYYQLKYIDFGFTSDGSKKKRKCRGGTAGYLPKEYYDKDLDSQKFDVFSLGITLLDAELINMNLQGFNSFQDILDAVIEEYDEKYDEDDEEAEYEFSKEQQEEIKNYNLYEEIKEVVFQEEKEKLLKNLETIYPDIVDIASDQDPELEYLEINPEEYLFIEPYLCNAILFEGLKIYFNKSFQGKFVTQEKEKWQQKIDETQAELNNDTSNEKLKKKLEIENKLMDITDLMMKLRLDSINVLLGMAEFSPKNRLSLSEALEAMNKLKIDFYADHHDDVDLFNKYYFEEDEDNEVDLKELYDEMKKQADEEESNDKSGSGSKYEKISDDDRVLLI